MRAYRPDQPRFPRLRAGTFIEAAASPFYGPQTCSFPRLRAGTFIEAVMSAGAVAAAEFPRLRAGTFIEASYYQQPELIIKISPPSGGDFH